MRRAPARRKARFELDRWLWVDLVAGASALCVYALTLAPSMTWRNSGADSGDLVSAAWTLGIPHPPGYPLFTLLAALAARWPGGEPAHNVGCLSALATAGAVFLLARAVRFALPAEALNSLVSWIPTTVALQFAFTPAAWSQATLPEVYGLHLLVATGLMLAMTLGRQLGPRAQVATMLGLGMGLAHHLSIVLFVPGLGLRVWQAFRTRKTAALGLLALLLPLSLYLYFPLRASTGPAINWGDPRTFERALWLTTAAAYRGYWFNLSAPQALERTASLARLVLEQFGVVGILLMVGGIPVMLRRRRELALALGLTFGLVAGQAIVYASVDSFVYLSTAFAAVSFGVAFGLAALLTRISSRVTRRPPVVTASGLALLAMLPISNLLAFYPEMDLSQDQTARHWAESALASLGEEAVVLGYGDEHIFALWYQREVVMQGHPGPVVVAQEQIQFSWYVEEILPRLGIQDLNLGALLALPYTERLQALVDASLAARRAVYVTQRTDWLRDYTYEPRGMLWQIVGRRP